MSRYTLPKGMTQAQFNQMLIKLDHDQQSIKKQVKDNNRGYELRDEEILRETQPVTDTIKKSSAVSSENSKAILDALTGTSPSSVSLLKALLPPEKVRLINAEQDPAQRKRIILNVLSTEGLTQTQILNKLNIISANNRKIADNTAGITGAVDNANRTLQDLRLLNQQLLAKQDEALLDSVSLGSAEVQSGVSTPPPVTVATDVVTSTPTPSIPTPPPPPPTPSTPVGEPPSFAVAQKQKEELRMESLKKFETVRRQLDKPGKEVKQVQINGNEKLIKKLSSLGLSLNSSRQELEAGIVEMKKSHAELQQILTNIPPVSSPPASQPKPHFASPTASSTAKAKGKAPASSSSNLPVQTGSGLTKREQKMIVMIGSVKAGNKSESLNNKIIKLADKMLARDEIGKREYRKIMKMI